MVLAISNNSYRLQTLIMMALTILLGFSNLGAQEDIHITQELGTVYWHRSYDKAIQLSKQSGKPVFLLFQEVPGCKTCQNFGKEVLSHPMMVEIIENEFIPLVIFNNRSDGEDARILKKFKEPAWNNPVVRIIDKDGKDIIERVSGQYSLAEIMTNINLALSASYRPKPEYFKLWSQELTTEKSNVSESVYSMYCFWSGEATLGQLDGVLATEAVWSGFKEAVLVVYDDSKISEEELDLLAQENSFKKLEINKKLRLRPEDETQYYLHNSKFSALALSPLQKSRINSALANAEPAEVYLSPKQLDYVNKMTPRIQRKNSEMYKEEFLLAWEKMNTKLEN